MERDAVIGIFIILSVSTLGAIIALIVGAILQPWDDRYVGHTTLGAENPVAENPVAENLGAATETAAHEVTNKEAR